MREASDEILERIAFRLKAMGNPVRLKILHALEGGELSVSDLLAQVGGSQANVSKHLNVLRSADLVRHRRDGLRVYYQICDAGMLDICRTVCDSLLQQANVNVQRIKRGRSRMLAGSTR